MLEDIDFGDIETDKAKNLSAKDAQLNDLVLGCFRNKNHVSNLKKISNEKYPRVAAPYGELF